MNKMIVINHKRARQKYTWSDAEFDNYLKNEAAKLKNLGIPIGTAGVTRILLHNVIRPNNVDLTKVISKRIKIRK